MSRVKKWFFLASFVAVAGCSPAVNLAVNAAAHVVGSAVSAGVGSWKAGRPWHGEKAGEFIYSWGQPDKEEILADKTRVFTYNERKKRVKGKDYSCSAIIKVSANGRIIEVARSQPLLEGGSEGDCNNTSSFFTPWDGSKTGDDCPQDLLPTGARCPW